MNVFLDIETIPDQSEGAIERFMGGEVKCPFKTKGEIGKDLGMTEAEYKFIPSGDFRALWVEKKGNAAAIDQAKEKWLKTSFDGARGQIVCIGYAFGNDEVKVLSTAEHSEKQMLEEFWHSINENTMSRPRRFIAHNTSFDLPFLWHRSVINRVNPSVKFDPWAKQGEKRYCTMEAWAGFKGMISLDNLAEILGVQGKSEGMSGADVWPEYEKGNIDKIAKYCADDVRVLRSIYNRINFL